MHKPRAMQIRNALKQLIGDVLALDGLKLLALLQRAGQVSFDELKHSVDVFDLLRHLPKDLIRGRASLFLAERRHGHSGGAGFVEQPLTIEVEQVLQPNNARVIDLQQIVELSIGAFGIDKVLKGINDLLNRDHPPRFLVFGLIHDPIGALADLLKYLIFLIDLVIQLLALFHRK